MTMLTKYSLLTADAPLRRLKKYSMIVFVLLTISTNLLNIGINFMTK